MVVRLRFGCGESAPSKTSKASTQPGYGTRFINVSLRLPSRTPAQ